MKRRAKLLGWVVLTTTALTLWGCGDDGDNGNDNVPANNAANNDTNNAGNNDANNNAPEDLDAVPGTAASFDLDADTSDEDTFYALPFPSDMRLTDAGTPDMEGFPSSGQAGLNPLLAAAQARPGWPMTPVAHFLFDGPIAPQDSTTAIAADPASHVLLIDIDPDSDERGTLYPTAAATHAKDDFVPDNLLAVGAWPGVVLHGERMYALVVRRSLGNADGEPLGVPSALVTMAADKTPSGARGAQAAALYQPLWETLDIMGIDRAEIAAATVLTTGDVVAETARFSDKIVADTDVTFDDLALDPDDGIDHPRFCELHGTIDMPQFQIGSPPFNIEGAFEFDADGFPIKQRDETIPVSLTLPKTPMPEGGYPLIVYIHGSGGLFTQSIDRGTITEVGGDATIGEGPAHVLAAHGFAVVGAAMPLNPERLPGAGDFDYINIANLGAFSYTFRQGAFEQRLLIEAAKELTVAPAVLEGCQGVDLPPGEDVYHFNTDALGVMGQSMGAQYTNLVAAIDPNVQAIAPTGSGGHWSLFMTTSTLTVNDVLVTEIAAGVLGTESSNLTYLHPALYLLQTAWEAGDALGSLPRIARRPFDGHPTRSIYQPVAPGDLFFPEPIFDAMSIAFGTQQVGPTIWESLQENLDLVERGGLGDYPTSGNRTSELGQDFTATVVQYEGDGIANPHTVFSQLDDIKHQYGCFFETFLLTGTATVVAPAALGSPCQR